MSCKKCEEFQDSGMTSYIRWGNANVEVIACEQHLREIFKVLNDNNSQATIIR